ncbi:hypothetical protein ACLOJK_004722 [Asimina triloba]
MTSKPAPQHHHHLSRHRNRLPKYLLLPNLLFDEPRSWPSVRSAKSGRCSSRHKIHFQNDDSSGDESGENLVVKRARVGVVPGWVTEREVFSVTPLGSIEGRGNSGRRPVGWGQLGFR